jgi:hypothetical protein
MSANLLDAANHTHNYAAKYPPDIQVFSSSVNDFLDFLEAKTKTFKPQGTKRKKELHSQKLSLSLLLERQPGLMLSSLIT